MPHIDFTNKDYFYNPLGSVKLKGEGEAGNISIPDCGVTLTPSQISFCDGIPDALYSTSMKNFGLINNVPYTSEITQQSNYLLDEPSVPRWFYNNYVKGYILPDINLLDNIDIRLHSYTFASSGCYTASQDTPDNCIWRGVLGNYIFPKMIFDPPAINGASAHNLEIFSTPFFNIPCSSINPNVSESVMENKDGWTDFMTGVSDVAWGGADVAPTVYGQPVVNETLIVNTYFGDKRFFRARTSGYEANFRLKLIDGQLTYLLRIDPRIVYYSFFYGRSINRPVEGLPNDPQPRYFIDRRVEFRYNETYHKRPASPVHTETVNIPPPAPIDELIKTRETGNHTDSFGGSFNRIFATYTAPFVSQNDFFQNGQIKLQLDEYSGRNVINFPNKISLRIG